MNKRITNKIRKRQLSKIAIKNPEKATVQEAWDIVADFLAPTPAGSCSFINRVYDPSVIRWRLGLYRDSNLYILTSSSSYDTNGNSV